jgi:hypothetical protein
MHMPAATLKSLLENFCLGNNPGELARALLNCKGKMRPQSTLTRADGKNIGNVDKRRDIR